jgi:hypothetical protein
MASVYAVRQITARSAKNCARKCGGIGAINAATM